MLQRAEILGVGNPFGVALAVVFPAVVLTLQPLTAMAARLVRKGAEAMRADVEKRPHLSLAPPDDEAAAQQVHREEIAVARHVGQTSHAMPARQEEPLSLP